MIVPVLSFTTSYTTRKHRSLTPDPRYMINMDTVDAYADSVGARIHLPADQVGQVVHLGNVSPCPITPFGAGSSVSSTVLDSGSSSNPSPNPKSSDTTGGHNKDQADDAANTNPNLNPNLNAADEKTQSTLNAYGPEMWEFLQRADGRGTTRALNIFKVGGEARE